MIWEGTSLKALYALPDTVVEHTPEFPRRLLKKTHTQIVRPNPQSFLIQ